MTTPIVKKRYNINSIIHDLVDKRVVFINTAFVAKQNFRKRAHFFKRLQFDN